MRAVRDVPVGRVSARPLVEIVVPVRDEARTLGANVGALVAWLDANPERLVPGMERQGAQGWRVTIAENGSADDTAAIARRLAARDPRIAVLELGAAGRGGALRAAWLASEADVVAYMDVDLSTNLAAFGDLVAPLLDRRAGVAIGTRLAAASRVRRRLRREVLSRGYNALARALCDARFSDAQCGFKALRADVARELVRTSPTTGGSSTPSSCCSPSAPGTRSTRCRPSGSRTSTRGCGSSRRSSPTSEASGASARDHDAEQAQRAAGQRERRLLLAEHQPAHGTAIGGTRYVVAPSFPRSSGSARTPTS